jgi:hypothetical protein
MAVFRRIYPDVGVGKFRYGFYRSNVGLPAILLPMRMPADYLLASVIATNSWNQRQESCNAFAYTIQYEDTPLIMLEANLLLQGGIVHENISAWIENFIKNINSFEEVTISAIKELDKDSKILKSGGGFWKAFGEVLSPIVRDFLLEW